MYGLSSRYCLSSAYILSFCYRLTSCYYRVSVCCFISIINRVTIYGLSSCYCLSTIYSLSISYSLTSIYSLISSNIKISVYTLVAFKFDILSCKFACNCCIVHRYIALFINIKRSISIAVFFTDLKTMFKLSVFSCYSIYIINISIFNPDITDIAFFSPYFSVT